VEHKKTGLTIIELLIVLGIIGVLVGLLVPAVSVVKKMARETKQKAQFATIELALAAFKNDYGDYPPSYGWDYLDNSPLDYCGAQRLAEALLGWDLMGFHPESAWRADGLDRADGPDSYDPVRTRDINGDNIPDTFDERTGPYLELATTNAFRLGNISVSKPGLFVDTGPLAPDTFVLCDVFTRKTVIVPNQVTGDTVRYKAGTPILYFKANASSKYLGDPEPGSIYRAGDNRGLMGLRSVEEQQQDMRQHPLFDPPLQSGNFLRNIMDPKVTTANRMWPYRPESYLLISAGADGLYGTPDDITNFGQ
jgi:type II secretory pathway pseudopilin PulG